MDDHQPANGLASLLLDPTRLRLVATLAGAGEVEFGFVRDRLGLSDSALSKQLRTLADVGWVRTRRGRTGARRRTWVRLTPPGRAVLAEHTRALREIAGAAESADNRPAG